MGCHSWSCSSVGKEGMCPNCVAGLGHGRINMGEVTYKDIERLFSKDDLSKYNQLCREFVTLTDNKNNIELWDLVQPPSRLRAVLDGLHTLRGKYKFLEGSVFFKVWRLDPHTKRYEEICW